MTTKKFDLQAWLASTDREVHRDDKRVRAVAIRRHFDELTLDPTGLWHPHAHATAVAGVRISRVRIGLLHGSVRMEHKHMVGKRGLGRPHQPRADDGIGLALATGTGLAGGEAEDGYTGSHQSDAHQIRIYAGCCPTRCGSIIGGSLGLIDNQQVHENPSRLQPQAQLFL